MKKAKAESWARKSVRQKMPFTAVTTGSFSEVMNPQAKNRVVTTRKAASAPRPELVAFILGFSSHAFDSLLEARAGPAYLTTLSWSKRFRARHGPQNGRERGCVLW